MKNLLILLAIGVSTNAHAQTNFFARVRVEFVKTLNLHAQMRETSPEWYERMKDNSPKEMITNHILTADTLRSYWAPGKEVEGQRGGWFGSLGEKNVIFSDLIARRVVGQKPAFEETFLMKDTILPIRWRITGDTRTIAGYNCRKAVGIIDDSVAVFAFYTDEITIPAGPETLHGLPGLILGVGMPRLHTTWFANKVDVFNVDMNKAAAPTKGKAVTRKEMLTGLEKIFKSWGTYGSSMMRNFLI